MLPTGIRPFQQKFGIAELKQTYVFGPQGLPCSCNLPKRVRLSVAAWRRQLGGITVLVFYRPESDSLGPVCENRSDHTTYTF